MLFRGLTFCGCEAPSAYNSKDSITPQSSSLAGLPSKVIFFPTLQLPDPSLLHFLTLVLLLNLFLCPFTRLFQESSTSTLVFLGFSLDLPSIADCSQERLLQGPAYAAGSTRKHELGMLNLQCILFFVDHFTPATCSKSPLLCQQKFKFNSLRHKKDILG